MTTQDARDAETLYAEVLRLREINKELAEALEWALDYGTFDFYPNDGDDIDAYLNAKAALAHARPAQREQGIKAERT